MRPTIYNSKVKAKSKLYLKTYKRYGHAIPSASGLAMVLGVARSTIYKWAKKHEEFQDILEQINTHQEQLALSGGLTKQFNAHIVKLLLGKHGYHDKQDVTSQGDNTIKIIREVVDGTED